jgi:hypothetical protein
VVRALELETARALAAEALELDTAAAVVERLQAELGRAVPDALGPQGG